MLTICDEIVKIEKKLEKKKEHYISNSEVSIDYSELFGFLEKYKIIQNVLINLDLIPGKELSALRNQIKNLNTCLPSMQIYICSTNELVLEAFNQVSA